MVPTLILANYSAYLFFGLYPAPKLPLIDSDLSTHLQPLKKLKQLLHDKKNFFYVFRGSKGNPCQSLIEKSGLRPS